MAKSSIAELAQRKADLLEELGEVNAEIASRAGEVDEPDDEPATVHTATDKTVQTAENTTATP